MLSLWGYSSASDLADTVLSGPLRGHHSWAYGAEISALEVLFCVGVMLLAAKGCSAAQGGCGVDGAGIR